MKLKGGDKFEAALKDIAAKLNRPGTLRVGFLEGATYPDSGQSVPEVAFFNEFGKTVKTKGDDLGDGTAEGTYFQLPRPFFRNMIAKNSDSWPGAIAQNLKANNYDTKAVLDLAGDGIKGQLQQSIQDTNSPPLAASTIAKKGFSKPLIDQGIMFNKVNWEVKL